jgi:hypothetical protein
MAVRLTSRLPYHRAALVMAKTNGPISFLRASACRERDARHKQRAESGGWSYERGAPNVQSSSGSSSGSNGNRLIRPLMRRAKRLATRLQARAAAVRYGRRPMRCAISIRPMSQMVNRNCAGRAEIPVRCSGSGSKVRCSVLPCSSLASNRPRLACPQHPRALTRLIGAGICPYHAFDFAAPAAGRLGP